MSLADLINRPCTLRHRTGGTSVDGDGNEVPDWEEIETVCELQQRQFGGGENAEEISDTQWKAYLLPLADLAHLFGAGTLGEGAFGGDIDRVIRSGDELVVETTVFQVEGDPWQARNPRTRQESHIEVRLRRVAGADD
jgi:hypothetical protein